MGRQPKASKVVLQQVKAAISRGTFFTPAQIGYICVLSSGASMDATVTEADRKLKFRNSGLIFVGFLWNYSVKIMSK